MTTRDLQRAEPRVVRWLRSPTPRNEATLIGVLVILSFYLDVYYLELLAGFLGLALIALSLDLIWGYGGILSFGQAAFFGLGGYGIGLTVTHWDASRAPFVGVALGILLPALAALILGLFVFYSRVGLFFVAVITLAISVLAEQIINEFTDFTGGFNGIILPIALPYSNQVVYLIFVGIFGVVLLGCITLVSSDFGRILIAIRDNEERTRFLGYSSPMAKTLVFTLAGVIAGIGGVMYSLQTGLVSPSLIGFELSTQAVIWVAVGGRGTLVGPAAGTLLINTFQQVLSGSLQIYWQLVLGLGLVLVVLFAPDGLYPWFLRLTRRFERDSRVALAEQVRTARTNLPSGGPALEVRQVSKHFGSMNVLSDVSMQLVTGELLCLVGPNGAGKSTLVDVVTGRTSPSSGTIVASGSSLDGSTPEVLVRQGIARKFQAATVFDRLSVFDNLALARGGGKLSLRQLVRRTTSLYLPAYVLRLMETGGLSARLTELAENLGHGEKQLLELCMVLAQEPRVVLLDEPTAGLTTEERGRIGELLRDLVEEQDIALLLIEHDLEFVRRVANRIIVLDYGRVVAQGTVADVAESKLVREIYLGEVQR